MWVQKILIPTPKKIIRNSQGVGGLNKGKYKARLESLGGKGWGGVTNQITILGMEYWNGYFLEPH